MRSSFMCRSVVFSMLFLFGCLLTAKAQLNMLFTNDITVSGWSSDAIYVTILRGQKSTSPLTADFLPDITYVNNTSLSPFSWNYATNILVDQVANPTNSNMQVFAGYTTNYGQGYSDSIKLSTIINNGGLQWVSNASSAQIIVSYGQAIDSTFVNFQTNYLYSNNTATSTTPYIQQNAFYWNGQLAPNNPSDPSYKIPYQNFEITYTGTNVGDQGDITAINYMGSFLSISSFQSTNATGTPLQTVGFLESNTTQVGSLLSTFTNIIGPSGYGNTVNASIVTNDTGKVVRVIGPSQFIGQSNGLGTYTNLASYLGYVQTSTSSNTVLSNSSSYNTVQYIANSGGNYTNVLITFTLTNAVTGDQNNGFGLSSAGTVTAVLIGYASSNVISQTTNTYTNIQMVVPAQYLNGGSNYPTAAAQFIYGASAGTSNYFVQNASYSNLSALLTGSGGSEAFVTGGGSNAFPAVQSQIYGELSAAFAFGLAGSTNTNSAGIAIGSMPSGQWWIASNGVLPFTNAQTNSAYYDIWASIIDSSSSNRVYGYAYSDRFGGTNSPLINDLQYNGLPVGSWQVTIGAPLVSSINSVPEPATPFLLGFGSLAGLVALLRSRRKS